MHIILLLQNDARLRIKELPSFLELNMSGILDKYESFSDIKYNENIRKNQTRIML